MIEKALKGGPRYWAWISFLLLVIVIGFMFYLRQLSTGLGITGMSRDISWGVYIAQFTYLVGVAAGAVMLVMPKYLHGYKRYGEIIIFGEFLAIAAVTMCLLFIVADLGQPMRLMNVLLHPTPNSILFWDMIVLNGYLLINLIVGYNTILAMKKNVPPPGWIKPFIYLSIPWAFSIHTVTAFLYCGLPGRHAWLTAIMAPRFLASAFASGPAFLVIMLMIIKRVTRWSPDPEAIQNVARTICYAMIANLFFLCLEFFTAFYSNIPGHMHPLKYLFWGLWGYNSLVPWMRVSIIAGVIGVFIMLIPPLRRKEGFLILGCAAIVLGTWIDKGVGLVIGGFIPNPFEKITEYQPTLPEISITLAIWATGFLILTVLYKMVIYLKERDLAVE